MKKKNFSKPFVLVAALFLAACGTPKQPVDSSEKPDDPISSVEPGKQTDNGFALADIVGEQVTLNPKAKVYVDAMREQAKTLQYEYRINPMYGPEDYGAGKNEQGDGYKYSEAMTGGVDVCEYLNRKDYNDMTPAQPVEIKWTKGSLQYVNATVEYWPKGKEATEKLSKSTTGTSVKIDNLYSNCEYEYRLVTDFDASWRSATKTFKTADYTRTINLDTLRNVRDLGGYATSYGGRTRQGLIFRGPEINSRQIQSFNDPRPANYTPEVQRVQDEVLKIGLQIDLKTNTDNDLGNNSRTKSLLEPADYVCYPSVSYANYVNGQTSADSIKKTFEAFANADKKHVYFHCQGGADRTGIVAFMLNAICGVSYTDLLIDFELTTQTNNKRCHMHNSKYAHFPDFLKAFMGLSCYDKNKSVNENAVAFLKTKGVSDATIEKIRTIMIEGYTTGDKADIKENEAYDTTKWAHDKFGHWNPSTTAGSLKRGNYKKHTSSAACSTCGYDGQGGSSTGGDTGGGDETHVHTWTAGAKTAETGCTDYETKSCTCGKKAIVLDAVKYVSTSDSFANKDSSGATLKMGANGQYVDYKFKLPGAIQNAEIALYGYVDYYTNPYSNKDKGFYVNGSANIGVTVNNNELVIGNHSTYAEMGMVEATDGSGNGAPCLCPLESITNLSAGENVLRYKRLGSYNLNISHIYLIGEYA